MQPPHETNKQTKYIILYYIILKTRNKKNDCFASSAAEKKPPTTLHGGFAGLCRRLPTQGQGGGSDVVRRGKAVEVDTRVEPPC